MAKQNSIDNATQDLTITPATGDSTIQFSINGTTEFIIGVDDDADDSFKIANGSALGTNDYLVMSPDGIMTLPLQSAFLNSINAEANVTGNSTAHYIGSVTATTSIVDRNGDMTEGDGAGTGATFTAPVTGLYQFNFTLVYDIGATGSPTCQIYVESTSDLYKGHSLPTDNQVTNFSNASGYICMNETMFMSLTAADTVRFRFQGETGSAAVDDVISGYISGCLIE